MIVNDSSSVIEFEKKVISEYELKRVGISQYFDDTSKHIVKVNGKYYYSKICRNRELISELIGTYLCNLVGLDVVDYQIGRDVNGTTDYFYALSEVFYKKGYFYSTVYDYYDARPDDDRVYSSKLDRFFICDTSVLDKTDDKDLIGSVMKMSAVDIKMGQIDRHNYNVMLRCAMNGKVEMEKLYDFGCGYDDDPPYPEYYCYDNPFLIVRKNTISIMSLVNKYPQIKESAAILRETPLYDVLKEIEKRFNIKIEDADVPGYLKMDKDFNKILRKIR